MLWSRATSKRCHIYIRLLCYPPKLFCQHDAHIGKMIYFQTCLFFCGRNILAAKGKPSFMMKTAHMKRVASTVRGEEILLACHNRYGVWACTPAEGNYVSQESIRREAYLFGQLRSTVENACLDTAERGRTSIWTIVAVSRWSLMKASVKLPSQPSTPASNQTVTLCTK